MRRYVGRGTDLTHLPLDKMAAISQKIYSNVFSRINFFYSNFTEVYSQVYKWQYVRLTLGNGLVPNSSQPLPEPMLIQFPGSSSQAHICNTRWIDSARLPHKYSVALTQLLHNHWSLRETYLDTGHRLVSLSVLRHNFLTSNFTCTLD